MSLLINLRSLDRHNIKLSGELPARELDLEDVDELVKLERPVKYDLEAQKLETNILVQGTVSASLDCECSRCLKPFVYELEFEDWTCLIEMEGEEKAVVTNDSVDLTPYLREDILLGFPQHPLCKAECSGLPKEAMKKTRKPGPAVKTREVSPTWAELNKLKF